MSGLVRIEHVYYVEALDEMEGIDGLVIRPMIDFDDAFILWSNYTKRRIVWFQHLHVDQLSTWETINEHPPEKIIIDDEEGHQIVLRELTLEYYEKLLQSDLKEHLHFKSTDDLQKYYLDQP